MPQRLFSNITGIDCSQGVNSDSLWMLMDATVTGPQSVRSREPFDTVDTNQDIAGTETHFNHVQSNGSLAAASYPWENTSYYAGIVVVDATAGTFTNRGDAPGYDTILAQFSGTTTSSTQVGEYSVFTGAGNMLWTGASVAPQDFLQGVDPSITASITSGSPTVTFSAAVPSLTSYVGAQISIENAARTLPRTFTVISVASNRLSLVVDVNLDETASGRQWALTSMGVWKGPAAFTAEIVCGHQGRLFASNGHSVAYSGTEDDSSGIYNGIHYWDADSVFTVVPEHGEDITAMASVSGDLLFFKDRGISVLRGVVANGDPSRLGARVDSLNTQIRCPNSACVQVTPRGAVLCSPDGVFLVTGEGVQDISEGIWPIFNPYYEANGFDISASFTMHDMLYFAIDVIDSATITADIVVYLAWNFKSNQWQFRTMLKTHAPCGVVTALNSSNQIVHIGMPKYSTHAIFTADVTEVSTTTASVTTTDKPMFMMVTAPFTGEDQLSHVRVRNIFTNVTSPGETANMFTVGALHGVGDYKAVINGAIVAYLTSGTAFANASLSEYTVQAADESWTKRTLASNKYGWCKSLILYNNDNNLDGASDPIFVNGLIADYDESGVVP